MYYGDLLLIYPGTLSDIIGIVPVVLVIAWQLFRKNRK